MARRTDGGARIGTETPNQGVRKRRGSVSALAGEDSARTGRQPVPPSPDKDPPMPGRYLCEVQKKWR